MRGDLGKAVERLKRESGKGLLLGGVTLPLALTERALIDEYELVVHPRLAGHGPALFAGLSKHVDLKLVSRSEFSSGAAAVAVRAEEVDIGVTPRSYAVACEKRMWLPNGSRSPQSMPYGRSVGSSLNSTPRAFRAS